MVTSSQLPPSPQYSQLEISRPTLRLGVCHIASGDAWGGAEAQVRTLVSALATRRDIYVCAIVLNDGRLAQELAATGIDVEVVPQNKHSFLKIVEKAHRFIQDKGVQLIHSHRYKENLIAAIVGMRNQNLRLVRTQHGCPEKLHGLAGMKQKAVYALDRLTGRFSADRVISVSEEMHGYLSRFVKPEKIHAIPNGIDLEQVRCGKTRADAKRHLGIAADQPVVGFVGRLERVKRLDLFVAVCTTLAARFPDLKVVIAGSGREEQKVRSLVCESGLETRTLILGHRNDSYEILRALDLLLITSDHEGLPMVVLEAMWLGTPVVSRAVGGVPELISDGRTGVLLKDSEPAAMASACSQLLCNSGLAETISSAARELVARRYSAERNCKRIVTLYESLLGIEERPLRFAA